MDWCYYPHRSRDSVSPVCGIFYPWYRQIMKSNNITHSISQSVTITPNNNNAPHSGCENGTYLRSQILIYIYSHDLFKLYSENWFQRHGCPPVLLWITQKNILMFPLPANLINKDNILGDSEQIQLTNTRASGAPRLFFSSSFFGQSGGANWWRVCYQRGC